MLPDKLKEGSPGFRRSSCNINYIYEERTRGCRDFSRLRARSVTT